MSETIYTIGATPATPATGKVSLFFKTDKRGYFIDDTGLVTELRPTGAGTGDLLADGTVPLTANWDVGAFDITAEQFHSDIATGTAPFTVASTTVVTNLNADQVDGLDAAAFVLVDGTAALTANWDAGSFQIIAETFQSDVVTGTAPFTVASTTLVTNLNADQLDGNEATAFATAAQGTLADSAVQPADINTLSALNTTVTDATLVDTADIFLNADVSEPEGFLRKTGAGTYEGIKSNLNASVAPTVNEDSGDGYAVGSVWLDTTADKGYVLLDSTVAAAVWKETTVTGAASPLTTKGDLFTYSTVDARLGVGTNGQVLEADSGETTGIKWSAKEPTKYIGQNLQSGTSYTLVLSDAGKIVEMNNAAANTLTIPANSSVAFPVDTRIDIVQYGAGQTTIAITTDTLRGNTKVAAQYNMVSLWKRASTEWVVVGGTV